MRGEVNQTSNYPDDTFQKHFALRKEKEKKNEDDVMGMKCPHCASVLLLTQHSWTGAPPAQTCPGKARVAHNTIEHPLELRRPEMEALRLRRAVRQCAERSPTPKFRSDAELPQTAEVDESAGEKAVEALP